MKVPSSPRFCVPATPRTSGSVAGPAPGSNGSQIVFNSPQAFLRFGANTQGYPSFAEKTSRNKAKIEYLVDLNQHRALFSMLRKNTCHNARGTIRTLGCMRWAIVITVTRSLKVALLYGCGACCGGLSEWRENVPYHKVSERSRLRDSSNLGPSYRPCPRWEYSVRA